MLISDSNTETSQAASHQTPQRPTPQPNTLQKKRQTWNASEIRESQLRRRMNPPRTRGGQRRGVVSRHRAKGPKMMEAHLRVSTKLGKTGGMGNISVQISYPAGSPRLSCSPLFLFRGLLCPLFLLPYSSPARCRVPQIPSSPSFPFLSLRTDSVRS